MHTQTSDFHLDTDNRNAKTHIEDWKISMLCKEHDLRPKHSHTFTPTFQSSIFWLFPNRVHGFSLSTGTRLFARRTVRGHGPVNDHVATVEFHYEKLEIIEIILCWDFGMEMDWYEVPSGLWFVALLGVCKKWQ